MCFKVTFSGDFRVLSFLRFRFTLRLHRIGNGEVDCFLRSRAAIIFVIVIYRSPVHIIKRELKRNGLSGNRILKCAAMKHRRRIFHLDIRSVNSRFSRKGDRVFHVSNFVRTVFSMRIIPTLSRRLHFAFNGRHHSTHLYIGFPFSIIGRIVRSRIFVGATRIGDIRRNIKCSSRRTGNRSSGHQHREQHGERGEERQTAFP